MNRVKQELVARAAGSAALRAGFALGDCVRAIELR